MRAREHAERSGVAGLGAPQLMRECERRVGIAGTFRLIELARETRSSGRVELCRALPGVAAKPRSRIGDHAVARGRGEQRASIGCTCGARGLFVELRGLGVTGRASLVALRERCTRGGDRGIERERLLEVDLRLRGIVELLAEDQRELEMQCAAIAWMCRDRDLAIQQRCDQAPLTAHHRGGTELIARISGSAGAQCMRLT